MDQRKGAIVNASNKVRIGNSHVTVIEGQVPFTHPSDNRFQFDIKENVPGLEFIKQLQPVSYYFDSQKLSEFSKTGKIPATKPTAQDSTQRHIGFLAQDVEAICKKMGFNFDGVVKPENDRGHYGISYSQFIMPLVKAVQEQEVIIEKQEKESQIQKQENDFLKTKLIEVLKRLDALEKKGQ